MCPKCVHVALSHGGAKAGEVATLSAREPPGAVNAEGFCQTPMQPEPDMQDLMTTTRSYATEIAELLRDRPDHDTPPAERQMWMQRKVQLLAAVEAVGATR